MPRLLIALPVVLALLCATPGLLPAQRIARPESSSLWNVRLHVPGADSTRRNLRAEGWTASTGAAAGGVIGVLAGMAAGLWLCRYREVPTGRSCGRDVPRGAVVLGGLGLLIGAITGGDAERRGQ